MHGFEAPDGAGGGRLRNQVRYWMQGASEVLGAKFEALGRVHGRPEAREVQEEEDEEYLHIRREQALDNQRKDANVAMRNKDDRDDMRELKEDGDREQPPAHLISSPVLCRRVRAE